MTMSATPLCPHFGSCGGCQLQDVSQQEQLSQKLARLTALLRENVSVALPDTAIIGSDPYQYRNRIRLRIERVAGALRFGYNVRTTTQFLSITECPIAAPVLWETADAIL